MKITFKKLLVSMCALVLAFTMTGCSIFLREVNVGDLDDSRQLSTTVTFTTSNTTEEFSLQECANLVKRSVVKIAMSTGGVSSSYASGVIVDIKSDYRQDDEYYIITSHHVIATPMDITVYVPDQNSRNHGDDGYDEEYAFTGTIGGNRQAQQQVSLVGGDKNSDVAVLKLDVGQRNVSIVQSTVPTNDVKVEYAQEVFAIGNPSGELPMTFLNGYISYIDRIAYISDVGYLTLIQHNCMITHGNSGGGLYNLSGQLIGITNAGSDTYKGMNYAIPFYGENGFVQIASQLLGTYYAYPNNYGYVSGRWNLGVTIENSASTVYGSKVRVISVEEDGNCTQLNAGDYITKVIYGDKQFDITTLESFSLAVMNARRDLKLGDSIRFEYYRPNVFGNVYNPGTATAQLEKQLIFCDTQA
ncbi:MAG: serine protease [Clostridiales bacterium]|nr:serine protease [Clostridiales bacterium]